MRSRTKRLFSLTSGVHCCYYTRGVFADVRHCLLLFPGGDDALPTPSADDSKADIGQAGATGEIKLLHLVAADGQRSQPDVRDAVAPAHVELSQGRCVSRHTPQPHVCDLRKLQVRKTIRTMFEMMPIC